MKHCSETILFGKPKIDKSGAFPTNEYGTNTKNNMPGKNIFRRRKTEHNHEASPQTKEVSKRPSVSSKCLEGRDSLQAQVEELSQRLRSSVEGSDDLRKRLAMISRYYETTVQRLSENIVSLQEGQVAMQGDLTKQIKSIDRERLVAIKRTELLLKEQQIAKFKRKQKQRF